MASIFALAASNANADNIGPNCKNRPDVVGACFKVHGRIGMYLGIPYRMWVIGTNHMLAIGNLDHFPHIEEFLGAGMPQLENYVYGDFEVCSLAKEHPGWMGSVCIESARDLVGEDLDDNLSRLSP